MLPSSPALTFRPRLLDALHGYTRRDFFADLGAGLTVGIVALPLAMAFAIASGVKPEAGLYTAILAGLLVSALGGSRVQIAGPTGAFVVIIQGFLATHGPEKLALCTLLAGGILLIMGLTRMGALIRFIPYPVTMGFTTGIAILILSMQLRDFMGLDLPELPLAFPAKLHAIATHLHTLHLPTFAHASFSLLVLLLWPRNLSRFLPPPMAVLLLGTLAALLLPWDLPTLGSRFGGIPSGFPFPRLPSLAGVDPAELIKPAFTIALLSAISSLLSAVVADGLSGERHDSNQELIAQGIANLTTPLFGGIAASGAVARTITNLRHGARSPLSGILHALVLLALLLAAAPLARHIPLGTLGAILVVVALRMGEWHLLSRLARWPKSDAAVYLATLLLTVFVDLTVAVEVGMVLASLLFLKRISETSRVALVQENTETEAGPNSLAGRELPKGVALFEIFGSFSFGVADRLETALHEVGDVPDILLLRMRSVLAMDATGLNALEDLHAKLRRHNRHLLLVAPHTQPLLMMDKAGFLDTLGRDNLCADLDHALLRAQALPPHAPAPPPS